jgi:hypothetical protein
MQPSIIAWSHVCPSHVGDQPIQALKHLTRALYAVALYAVGERPARYPQSYTVFRKCQREGPVRQGELSQYRVSILPR